MFSVNRHECSKELVERINSGTTIVCDRYCYSGAAYTMAKSPVFDYDWCIMPDVGLPAPDMVLFLDMDIEQAASRGEFGEERYEKKDFQKKIRKNFHSIIETTKGHGPEWTVVNAAQPSEEVHAMIRAAVDSQLRTQPGKAISYFSKSDLLPHLERKPLDSLDNTIVQKRPRRLICRSGAGTPSPAPPLTTPLNGD